MSLLNMVKAFAQEHRIVPTYRKNNLIGKRGRLMVRYWNNSFGETMSVNRSFPPLKDTYESEITIVDDGKPLLKVKILYGCLEDYLTQLHRVDNDLCKVVREILFDPYISLINHPPASGKRFPGATAYRRFRPNS